MANKLDHKLRAYRQVELSALREDAGRLRENARGVGEALAEVEHYLAQLHNMATDVGYKYMQAESRARYNAQTFKII